MRSRGAMTIPDVRGVSLATFGRRLVASASAHAVTDGEVSGAS